MTIEEARKELGEYLYLLKLCDLKKRKIDELRRLVQSCKGITYGDHLGNSGGDIAYQIAKIADFEKELELQKMQAEEKCKYIEGKIYKVGEERVLYANILEMRYVLGYKMKKIAVDINYDYGWTKKLLSRAVKRYAKI